MSRGSCSTHRPCRGLGAAAPALAACGRCRRAHRAAECEDARQGCAAGVHAPHPRARAPACFLPTRSDQHPRVPHASPAPLPGAEPAGQRRQGRPRAHCRRRAGGDHPGQVSSPLPALCPVHGPVPCALCPVHGISCPVARQPGWSVLPSTCVDALGEQHVPVSGSPPISWRSWLEAAAGESAEVALVDALLRVLRLLPLPQGILEVSGACVAGRVAGRRASFRAVEPVLCCVMDPLNPSRRLPYTCMVACPRALA